MLKEKVGFLSFFWLKQSLHLWLCLTPLLTSLNHGVFCTDNLCFSMHTLLLLPSWYNLSGTSFYFPDTWQGSFNTKTLLLKAHGKNITEFTDWQFYLEEPELCPQSEVKGLCGVKMNDHSREASLPQSTDCQEVTVLAGQEGEICFGTIIPSL